MGGTLLTERQVVGRYFWKLEQEAVQSWAPLISNLFQSDHAKKETVGWLGSAPAMKEWAGERAAKELQEESVEILLSDYEATEQFTVDEFNLDKSDQVMTRIDEMAIRGVNHWSQLLTDLMVAGETKLCYDGQFFYDTDHVSGESGSQSNIVSISGLGDPRTPTVAQVETLILDGIARMLGHLDDEGEPFSPFGTDFLLQVPVGLWRVAATAIGADVFLDSGTARSNVIATLGDQMRVRLVANARLDGQGATTTGWYAAEAARMALFKVDNATKPFIRFQGMPLSGSGVNVSTLGPQSEHAILNRKVLFGADAKRGSGYGHWQLAVLLLMED